MTPIDADDPILRMLSRLPAPEPGAVRSRRVVERCHAAMARRDRWQRQRRRFERRIVEPALVGAFALTYLAAMVRDLWHWRHLP